MNALPQPKTDLAEILRPLAMGKEISERQFSQNGFRSRLTELRRLGLNLRSAWKEFRKRGRKSQYKVHYIWRREEPKAKKLYLKINKVA